MFLGVFLVVLHLAATISAAPANDVRELPTVLEEVIESSTVLDGFPGILFPAVTTNAPIPGTSAVTESPPEVTSALSNTNPFSGADSATTELTMGIGTTAPAINSAAPTDNTTALPATPDGSSTTAQIVESTTMLAEVNGTTPMPNASNVTESTTPVSSQETTTALTNTSLIPGTDSSTTESTTETGTTTAGPDPTTEAPGAPVLPIWAILLICLAVAAVIIAGIIGCIFCCRSDCC